MEVGGVWGGQGVVSTHGWVLPTGTGRTQTFAICWNAVIYPVNKVGKQVDLRAELANAPPLIRSRVNRAPSEMRSVFLTNSSTTRVPLLLRCGETEAALKAWNGKPELDGGIAAGGTNADPYLEMASDFAWALFDHIISAHMRGSADVALASARKLAEVSPRIEAEAARRGFVENDSSGLAQGAYLTFLSQLPDLLVDLERRARGPQRNRITDEELAQIPVAAKRIDALIDALNLVQARQWSQPGGVNFTEDPIIAALIREGDAAVEPLLSCLKNDKRLTQSVRFHRSFFRNREVLPVSSAARAILQNILKVQFVGASEFRHYWERSKGLKLEERWFATLKDDEAGTEDWLQAAANIMQPENVTGVPGLGFYTVAPVAMGDNPKLRGELLRGKEMPSVTDLLVKRANAIAKKAQALDQGQAVIEIRNGCEFVDALAKWESPSAGVAPARLLMQRAIELWQDDRTFTTSLGRDLARLIPQLTQVRVLAGETQALTEYAQWIKSATPRKAGGYELEAFEPLVKNSGVPSVVSVSDWLFDDPNSPWRELPWPQIGFQKLIESGFARLPAFRRRLIRDLDKRDVIGSMEYTAQDTVRYEIHNWGSGIKPWPASQKPQPGTKVELRTCDWIAWCLADGKYIAFFDPLAALGPRDAAIEEVKATLAAPNLGTGTPVQK